MLQGFEVTIPFVSTLDTRQGYWTKRKRFWRNVVGIKRERDRGDADLYDSKDWVEKYGTHPSFSPISAFDPLLCEVIYNWFSSDNARVLDPFSGGVVRGAVAALIGREYVGVDLRKEQVDENKEDWPAIFERATEPVRKPPVWIVGDSRNITNHVLGKFDFLFSCPPYYDLETYCEDEADLSNCVSYEEFLEGYRIIIKESCSLLSQDCFAVFVVGNLRDKKTGLVHDLVGDTVRAFEGSGLSFYNDIVILDLMGTAFLRASSNYRTRKVVRVHQNVVVFVKGDWKVAAKNLGNSKNVLRDFSWLGNQGGMF